LDGLSGLWIPPLACGSRSHIERAKARDTDRIAGHEGIEDGVYDGLHGDNSGLAFAALALATASLAAAVRRGEMSVYEIRAFIADAHALAHDRAGFVVDPDATEAADDFLSAAEALALAPRMPDNGWRG
jgi:hypothetical protein